MAKSPIVFLVVLLYDLKRAAVRPSHSDGVDAGQVMPRVRIGPGVKVEAEDDSASEHGSNRWEGPYLYQPIGLAAFADRSYDAHLNSVVVLDRRCCPTCLL